MEKHTTRILFRGIGPDTNIHYNKNELAKNGESPTVDVDFACIMYSSGYAIPYTEKDSELVIRRETADNNKRSEIKAKVEALEKGGN